LLDGQDPSALRSASIIERKLRAAGATEGMIEFATQQKVQWDVWVRGTRHAIPEFELNFLLQRIHEVQVGWLHHGGSMAALRHAIEEMAKDASVSSRPELTNDLLLGGILADLVRSKTR
jgi:hypothetical protein